MKNTQPIGIFDSGIGGLTIAKAINQLLPNEKIIYFGDTLHLPYGDKSEEAIRHYCQTIAWFLAEKNCKAIVIACNTASATSYELLKKMYAHKLPVINVIDPLIKYIGDKDFKSIGILATPRTIATKTYQQKLLKQNKALIIRAIAAKSLASIIEEGFQNHPSLINAIIEHYFSKSNFPEIDALILGCTHYPVLQKQIQAFRKDTKVIDAPLVVAKHLKAKLSKLDLLSDAKKNEDKHKFYISDYTSNFTKTAKIFFGEKIELDYCPLFSSNG